MAITELKKDPHTISLLNKYAEFQTKRLTLVLDLSSKQRTSVKALQLDIIQKKEANWFDEKTNTSNDERYAKMISRLDMQIEIKSMSKSILNANQYEKWQKLHPPRKKRSFSSRQKAIGLL